MLHLAGDALHQGHLEVVTPGNVTEKHLLFPDLKRNLDFFLKAKIGHPPLSSRGAILNVHGFLFLVIES